MKLKLILFFIPLSTSAVFLLTIANKHYKYGSAWFVKGTKWEVATSIVEHGILGIEGHPTTDTDPLYPLLLALFRVITGNNLLITMFLQATIFAIGAVYLYKLGAVLFKSSSAAVISALLYSLYPYYIGLSVGIQEVPLVTTLLIMYCFYCQTAKDTKGYVLCGIVSGMLALSHSAMLPLVVLWIMWCIYNKQLGRASIIAVSFCLVVSPFYLRNYMVDGSLLPSRLGNNLHKGNCKYTDQINPTHNFDVLEGYHHYLWRNNGLTNATQKRRDTFLINEAVNYVITHPLATIKIKLLNFYYMFYPRLIPELSTDFSRFRFDGDQLRYEGRYWKRRSTAAEVFYTLSFTPILILSIPGFLYRRKYFTSSGTVLYLVVISFLFTYCVLFFPGTRYRAPMDFILMLYAAAIIDDLICRGKKELNKKACGKGPDL